MKILKFTLIELLVVVAIISILASILMPSLSKARASAVFAVCKSNSKQISLGVIMYSSDNSDWVAPTHQGNNDKNQVWSEHTVFPHYLSSQQVFKCPNDEKGEKSYGPNGGSTAYNGLVEYGKSLLKFSQVENDTYLLLEKRSSALVLDSGWPDIAVFQFWQPGQWSKSSDWHVGAISYSFIDGHVEGLKTPRSENFTPFAD